MASHSVDSERDQFDKEVAWCICSLKKSLQKADPTRNQVKEALKALQVLESVKAPVVKKRLAMRNALGDYRATMAAEEKMFATQVLNGQRRLAEFSTDARPPEQARALHVHNKNKQQPPKEQPSQQQQQQSLSVKSGQTSPSKPSNALAGQDSSAPDVTCSQMRFAFDFDVSEEGENQSQ